MARPFERQRGGGDEGAAPEAATEVLPGAGADAVGGHAAPAGDEPAAGEATASEATADGAAASEAATGDTAAGGPVGDAATAEAAPGANEATSTTDVATTPETQAEVEPQTPGFVARGQLRRRLRYVRRAREVALRDLGGLVFELHRFGRDRNDLVDRKLTTLTALDAEMRALEAELDDRRDVTVLREPGLGSCPSCGALHSSDARFCSHCGLALNGDGEDRPARAAADEPTIS